MSKTSESQINSLLSPSRIPFSSWPPSEDALPAVAAGVYAIWRGDRLFYAGMAGRGLTPTQNSQTVSGRKGLWQRLEAHRSGRRSGDQFCVYVADYEIVPSLTPEQLQMIRSRKLKIDHLVRDFVAQELCFTFAVTDDGASARELEKSVIAGALGEKPELNAWAQGPS